MRSRFLIRSVALLALCTLLCCRVACAKSPPGTITIVSAGQAGLLKGIGVLNPHAYRPNEFVVQNWVYEGLVHYGAGGKIVPALAESWELRNHGRQQDIIFNLRR
jgi:ABC-type transport system substrate-binding protein